MCWYLNVFINLNVLIRVRLEEVLFLMKCKRYYECLWNEDIYVMFIYILVIEFILLYYVFV